MAVTTITDYEIVIDINGAAWSPGGTQLEHTAASPDTVTLRDYPGNTLVLDHVDVSGVSSGMELFIYLRSLFFHDDLQTVSSLSGSTYIVDGHTYFEVGQVVAIYAVPKAFRLTVFKTTLTTPTITLRTIHNDFEFTVTNFNLNLTVNTIDRLNEEIEQLSSREEDVLPSYIYNLGAVVENLQTDPYAIMSCCKGDILHMLSGQIADTGESKVSHSYLSVVDAFNYPSFTLYAESDQALKFVIQEYGQQGGTDPAAQYSQEMYLDTDGKYRMRISGYNIVGGSWDAGVENDTGTLADLSIMVIAYEERQPSTEWPINWNFDSYTGHIPVVRTVSKRIGQSRQAEAWAIGLTTDGHLTLTHENGTTYTGAGSLSSAGIIFWMTDFSASISSLGTAIGKCIIRDGIGGRIRIPLQLTEAPTLGVEQAISTSGSQGVQPRPFTDSIYFEEISGSCEVDIIINGYIEPL